MGNPPQYRAELSETALPEILSTLHRHRMPGVVEACRDQVVKRIFLRDGEVVYASSTDRNDSLGVYLRRTGRLTVEDFRRISALRGESRKKAGELLVESGLLSPAEIYMAIREQVEAVVWSLFAWTDGTVSFEIDEVVDRSLIRIGLPLRHVILEGIQRAPVASAKALAARLGGRKQVFEPSYQLSDLIEIALDHDQTRLLNLVNGQRTLLEVCGSGPSGTLENAKMMYGFMVLGLIRPRDEEPPPERSTAKFKFKTGRDRSSQE